MAVVKWYGEEVKAHIDVLVGKRIDAALIYARDFIRQMLSISGKAKVKIQQKDFVSDTIKGSKEAGIGLGKVKTKRGGKSTFRSNGRSQPGEYPRKQLGHLRRNVQKEYSAKEKKGRIGTNVIYGKYLELGTRKMRRRPWLSMGLNSLVTQLRNILAHGAP